MTTKKKWAIGIGVFLALGLLGSVMDDGKGSTSNENKTESQQSVQTEQKQKEEADRQAREQKEKADRQAREQKEEADRQAREQKEKQEGNFIGTYEVTDKVGCTIRITINEDETATITGVKGENVTYYCSWNDWRKTGYGIGITFSDERPYLVFEGGDNTAKYPRIHLKDGWLYTSDAVKSNNPKWRLKATKIN